MKTFQTLAFRLCAAAIGIAAIPAIASAPAASPPSHVANPAVKADVNPPPVNGGSNLASLFTVQNNTPQGPLSPRREGGFGNNQSQGAGPGNFRDGGGFNNTVLMIDGPEGCVYILRGNTLYKISADMKIIGQVTLPMPQRPQFGPGGNDFGGSGGGQGNANPQANPPGPAR